MLFEIPLHQSDLKRLARPTLGSAEAGSLGADMIFGSGLNTKLARIAGVKPGYSENQKRQTHLASAKLEFV